MGARTGQTSSPAGHVRLRYWASARAAAGVEEDVLEVGAPVTLEDLRERARALHAGSARFSAVLDTCSVLVGDRPVASADPAAVRVAPGETVEFLPPFAGG
jgi:molybdopterin converting factor small subunit